MFYKGFWISLVAAMLLYIGWLGLDQRPLAFFLPLGLWVGCFMNAWVGSKVLGWVCFSVAFVSWMTVLGAFGIRWHLDPHLPLWAFARALLMYGALAMAGLYQLKGGRYTSPPDSEDHP